MNLFWCYLITAFLSTNTNTNTSEFFMEDPFVSPTQQSVGDSVLQAERNRFRAMVERDFDILDNLIGEDLVYIHSNGSSDTKESFIGAITDGSRLYDDITISDPKVRVYGSVGIINATCTYHRTSSEGRPNNLTLRYTSVYAKIDQRWQHVSWQSFKVE